jgi:hypothetical protein
MPEQKKNRKEEKARQNLKNTYESLDPEAAENSVFITDKKKK